MGQGGSAPADGGWGYMKKYDIKSGNLALSEQEAEKCWDLVDEKKEGTLKKEVLKKAFDELGNIFTEKVWAENKEKLDKLVADKKTEKEKKKQTAELDKIKAAVKAEFTNHVVVTYFLRSAKMKEDKVTKQQFVSTAVAGGKLVGHEDFKWANFNKYVPPSAEEIAATKAPAADEKKAISATEKAQLDLRKQRAQLITRDDTAEKQAKELRTALVERLQEIFRKCDKAKAQKLAVGSQLRTLVQVWYVPSDAELDNFIKQFGGEAAVNSDAYVKALLSSHPASEKMTIEPELQKELKEQFEAIAGGADKTLPIERVRELAKTTYLAPVEVVDKFVSVLDEDKDGFVNIVEIIDAYSTLETLFPEIFARLHKLERERIAASAPKAAPKEAPKDDKKDEKKA